MIKHPLIKSINQSDYVTAEKLVNEQLTTIIEHKLLARKKLLGELMGYRGSHAKSGPLVGKTDSEKKAYWKKRIDQRKVERDYDKTNDTSVKGGKLSKAGIEAKRKQGYVKAVDALGDRAFMDKLKAKKEKETSATKKVARKTMSKSKSVFKSIKHAMHSVGRSKPVAAAKAAAGIWKGTKEPTSLAGHALKLVSKTLQQAE
jgi:hypothetical protein